MYQLFNIPFSTNYGTITNPNWVNVKAVLLRNLSTVVDYYKTHTFSAPIDTILVSIINKMGSGLDMSDSQFYAWCQKETLAVSQSLHITSSASRGKVHVNQFFGPGIREVIVSDSESFDYRKVLTNWKNETSVTVLSHPFSDLSIPLLNRKNESDQKGYAVISINVPKLMIQYRAFRLFERTHREQGLPITSFIHRFVLPNICPSILDYAIFNRFYRNYFGIEHNSNSYRHPFYITDWSSRVDDSQNDLISYVKAHHLSFQEFMKTIPLVSQDTVLNMSDLPDFYRTRQVNWALAISRLDLLHLLIHNNRITNGDRNRSYINSIKRHIEFYKNDQIFNQALTHTQAREVNDKINEIVDLI